MIQRVLHIARREWLEHRRQPAMLGAIASLYGIVTALVLAAVAAADFLERDPDRSYVIRELAGADADPTGSLQALAGSALALFTFLGFTQFLGITSVMAGHALLHDRQCGTFTFLLLAPVRRGELLLGKVLGALGWPWLLYGLFVGGGGLALSFIPISAAYGTWLPRTAGWWVATLFTAPAWALFVAAACAVISARAVDVRTAQQGVWFVVFFAGLLAGSLLTWALQSGIASLWASFALGAAGAGVVLVLGAAWLGDEV